MNKNDLVNKVSDGTGLSKTDSAKAVDSVFDVIMAELKSGGDVRLVGFGTFLVTKRKATIHISPKHSSTIQTKTINQILDSYASKPISFLSIDVECMEFDILKSWNFKKFRPILICVEIKESNIFNQFYEHKIVKLLMNNGYTFHVQTLSGAIFKSNL